MRQLPGGTFRMGSDRHYPEEGPVRTVHVEPFAIDEHTVTNAEFGAFVASTGYITVAERLPDPAAFPAVEPDLLVPGSLVFRPPSEPVDLTNPRAWWSYVPDADWRDRDGPGSEMRELADHPVVHVAHEDAQAYARWAGKTLPTEAQWEYAARGGVDAATYAWGDELTPEGRFMANTWQGNFPYEDSALDGWAGTSPVGSFPANGWGLHDMIGNVWEWTRDPYLAVHSPSGCCPTIGGDAPTATATGSKPASAVGLLVVKGGSYLCAPSHCERYRPAARSPQSPDTSSCHLGFRCVIGG